MPSLNCFCPTCISFFLSSDLQNHRLFPKRWTTTSDLPMRSLPSLCHHTSAPAYKGKDEYDFIVPKWIGLTFHMLRADRHAGTPRHATGSFTEDDAHRFLQERGEARSLHSNMIRNLGRMDFHLNAMQDALTISKNGAHVAWASLTEADARITGKTSKIFFFYTLDFLDF